MAPSKDPAKPPRLSAEGLFEAVFGTARDDPRKVSGGARPGRPDAPPPCGPGGRPGVGAVRGCRR